MSTHALPPLARPVEQPYVRTARFDVQHLLGLMVAFFVLVGRWTPNRLGSRSVVEAFYFEPRFLAVLVASGLAVIVACKAADRRAISQSGRLGSQVWFWLFWGYIACSTMWAADYELAGTKLYELLLIATLQLVVVSVVKTQPRRNLVEGIVIGLLLVSLPMLLMGLYQPSSVRTGGLLGGGPNVFGRQMLILSMSAAYFMTQQRLSLAVRIGLIGIMVMATGLVVLSGSRGALLSQIVGIGTLVLFMKSSMSTRVTVIFAGAMVGLCVLLFTEFGEKALLMFENRVLKQTVEQGHMAGRETLYWSAIEIGTAEPIFGNGLNTFRAWFDIYPHNIFLELFAETGAVGIALFLVLIAVSLRPALAPDMELEVAFFSLWLGLLAAANFSGDLFDSRLVFLFLPLLVRAKRGEGIRAEG